MIIEIFGLLLAFACGFLIASFKNNKIICHQNTSVKKLTLWRTVSVSSKSPSTQSIKISESISDPEFQEEEKPVNKKKKNKKKKKDKQESPLINQNNNVGNQESFASHSDPNNPDEKSLWNSTQINSVSGRPIAENLPQSRSCEAINSRRKDIEEQDIEDFIIDELELLRSYFIEEVEQIIPYSKKTGKYRLTLAGTTKQIVLEWKYNDSKYPEEQIHVKFLYDSLKPVEIDKLNQILNQHQQKFQENKNQGKFYNFIFNLSTAIYQDLLMQIHEEPDQNLFHQNKQKETHHFHAINQSNLNDTTELFTNQKKQIYGKLVEEIFYMHDFKSEPNESQLINKLPEQAQKKYHPRGRYADEFQELEMIGEGGFGKVYKAKNRLDSNTYAIKKIAINYENSKDRKLLNEVTFFSTLNHPNIVRYHQSWLEDTNNMDQLFNDMPITDPDEREELQHMYQDWCRSRGEIFFQEHSHKRKQSKPLEKIDSDDEEDDDDIMFEEDDNIHFEDYSGIQFKDQSKSVSVNPHANIEFQDSSSQENEGQKTVFPFKILYIVMEFVKGITLKDFIATRFKEDEIKIQIIRGILQGLAYIHSKKIIHRDLKPANIFLTQNNKVKIGDFGLATTGSFEEKATQEIYDKSYNMGEFEKTIGIGTAFYRAPEQLKSPKYDEKVDIYSLGIIIFEMFYELHTYSERFKILSDISKNFTLPKDFNLYGQLTDYQISIENCLKQQPQNRPTARKLLENFRNKYFIVLVSAIANPKYAQFYELIKHLFQISNERRIQGVRRNYFRTYDFQEIFNIYRIHRGNLFQSFPLIFTNDYKTINGFKIQANNSRRDKFLVMSQQGVLLEYASNLYAPWIIYAKETMRRKRKNQFFNDELNKVYEMRRFTFQKVTEPQYDAKKDETVFKQKYVTGFDICYDIEEGFSPFLTLEMLIISSSIAQTVHSTQKYLSVCICHSKIYMILSKHYKIPLGKLYNCLLSTSEQAFSLLTESKKLEYFEKFQISGLAAKKMCQLLEQTFEQFSEWIQSFQIWNIEEYTEYWQIYEQIKQISALNEHFELQSIEYKLMIPPNSCNGLFWNAGLVRGFTAIEDYNIETWTGYLCNLNIELNLPQGDDICDVSIWSNQQFLQSEIMELISKCWQMRVSSKFYDKGIGEKDQTAKMNLIIKKKKGERVHYYIRNNESKKGGIKLKSDELSSVVVKEQFNYEVFKQLQHQPLSSSGLFGINKKKSE